MWEEEELAAGSTQRDARGRVRVTDRRPAPSAGLAADPAAMSCLYLDLKPAFQAIIGRLTANRDMRQDLLGESYIAFHRLVARYDPARRIPLNVYVVSQMRYQLYTLVRAHWSVEMRNAGLESADLATASLSDPSDSWDDAMICAQTAARVLPLLERISIRQKSAITWRFYDDMSYEEIASKLGIQTSTARSLLRHGLCRLRNLAVRLD